MGNLINIGFGNMVNSAKIMAIINPDSAPARGLVQKAKEDGRVIDGTQGRRTRAILAMDDSYIVLSALMPETLANRYRGKNETEMAAAESDTVEDEA